VARKTRKKRIPHATPIQFPDALLPLDAETSEYRADVEVLPTGTDFEPEPRRADLARPKSSFDAALPWVLAAIVVLLLAASAGLGAAWLVATMHAVPPPVGAGPTPTLAPGVTPAPSGEPTPGASQPRRTPMPSPLPTQSLPPFTYVVQRGDSVTGIADTFAVNWEDIVALNGLKAPKYRIFPGQELLIPGYGTQPTPKPRH
jgi:LysM repeat protein